MLCAESCLRKAYSCPPPESFGNTCHCHPLIGARACQMKVNKGMLKEPSAKPLSSAIELCTDKGIMGS